MWDKAKAILIRILKILGLILLGLILFAVSRTPSTDRIWIEHLSRNSEISITGNQLEIVNIRSWKYEGDQVVSKEEYTETFDLEKLERAWFLLEPFPYSDLIGHTFFVFDFSDGKSVGITVEARKEAHEKFSALWGLFNKFELIYKWADPDDLIIRRAVYLNHDLHMYPLDLGGEALQEMVLQLARTTNEVNEKPQFYNTIFHNCTNTLVKNIEKVRPRSVPWDWARVFTGLSDNFLYSLHRIPHYAPVETVIEDHRITQYVRDHYQDPEFGKNLRKMLLELGSPSSKGL